MSCPSLLSCGRFWKREVDRQYFAGLSPVLVIEITTGMSSPTLNRLFTGPCKPPPVLIVTLIELSESGAAMAAPLFSSRALELDGCKLQRMLANSSEIKCIFFTLHLLYYNPAAQEADAYEPPT